MCVKCNLALKIGHQVEHQEKLVHKVMRIINRFDGASVVDTAKAIAQLEKLRENYFFYEKNITDLQEQMEMTEEGPEHTLMRERFFKTMEELERNDPTYRKPPIEMVEWWGGGKKPNDDILNARELDDGQ